MKEITKKIITWGFLIVGALLGVLLLLSILKVI